MERSKFPQEDITLSEKEFIIFLLFQSEVITINKVLLQIFGLVDAAVLSYFVSLHFKNLAESNQKDNIYFDVKVGSICKHLNIDIDTARDSILNLLEKQVLVIKPGCKSCNGLYKISMDHLFNVVRGYNIKTPLIAYYTSYNTYITSSRIINNTLRNKNNYYAHAHAHTNTHQNTLIDLPKNDVDLITPGRFDEFWKLYPKKTDKGKALDAWKKLCQRKTRPSWKEVKGAILAQIETPRWRKGYIPVPTTWINQSRWLDDPEQMVDYGLSFEGNNLPEVKRAFGEVWYLRKEDREYYNDRGEMLRE